MTTSYNFYVSLQSVTYVPVVLVLLTCQTKYHPLHTFLSIYHLLLLKNVCSTSASCEEKKILNAKVSVPVCLNFAIDYKPPAASFLLSRSNWIRLNATFGYVEVYIPFATYPCVSDYPYRRFLILLALSHPVSIAVAFKVSRKIYECYIHILTLYMTEIRD